MVESIQEEEKKGDRSSVDVLFSKGEYVIRYPKSVEEMLLSDGGGKSVTPLEMYIDALMDDPSAIVFGLERSLVSDIQYSSIEGFIQSDTLVVIEHKSTR
jgi:hypothetical protein